MATAARARRLIIRQCLADALACPLADYRRAPVCCKTAPPLVSSGTIPATSMHGAPRPCERVMARHSVLLAACLMRADARAGGAW